MEQMPQIEMPINNATSTELTIEGGNDGKKLMKQRDKGKRRNCEGDKEKQNRVRT